MPAPFVITEAKAIAAAEGLYQDMRALADGVTRCVTQKAGTPATCICSFPGELRRVQQSLARVEASYPEWRAKIVNWTEPQSRQSRAISLESLKRQSRPECPAR